MVFSFTTYATKTTTYARLLDIDFSIWYKKMAEGDEPLPVPIKYVGGQPTKLNSSLLQSFVGLLKKGGLRQWKSRK